MSGEVARLYVVFCSYNLLAHAHHRRPRFGHIPSARCLSERAVLVARLPASVSLKWPKPSGWLLPIRSQSHRGACLRWNWQYCRGEERSSSLSARSRRSQSVIPWLAATSRVSNTRCSTCILRLRHEVHRAVIRYPQTQTGLSAPVGIPLCPERAPDRTILHINCSVRH
jgi:hypothetical protein